MDLFARIFIFRIMFACKNVFHRQTKAENMQKTEIRILEGELPFIVSMSKDA